MSRKRDDRALLNSEQSFRLLVEGVIDYAIYMLDVNGTVASWNRGAERIKGYTADEIIGQHFSQFYTPEDRQAGAPVRALEAAHRDGRYEAEGWRVRKDGARFWANVVVDAVRDDSGRLIGFAKITRDISERREAENALRESERQFRLLVLGVTDYALYMLDPNGIVTNWNAGAQHIKGYGADEIVGRHFSQFYTEPDRVSGKPMRALEIALKEGRYEAEGWRVKKNGEMFWASVVIDAIRDEQGQLVGFAKITRDITERRAAQLELQKAHQQLAQVQKMEALGKLTGGVAHDFNNLLMVVSGQAQLLRGRVGSDARAQRAIDAIEVSAKRGADLTRHLLAFSRRQRLQSRAIALADRLDALSELIGASLPPNVSLDFELPADLWQVEADPSELEVALLNLALNARDAMPSGGRLIISAANTPLTEEALNGDFVAVRVSDTGSGIPADILAKVFDPFFTTKDVDKGTGLGLSQVYGFVQQSGGDVRVETELGRGTTFTLLLPRAVEGDRRASADDRGEHDDIVSARILMVEDNPEVAEVAARMLEELGHSVQIANSAVTALTLIEQQGQPDLLFSDIVMAGEMDGIALARRLREIAPGVPILLATGYSEAAERIGEEFPILRKPYQLAELSRAVSLALASPPPPDGNLIDLATVRKVRA